MGFRDILLIYLSKTFKLSLGFILTYILSSGSVLLFAVGFPLLTIRWDRLVVRFITPALPDVFCHIRNHTKHHSFHLSKAISSPRRLRLWLTTSKEHVYESISHYSSQYSSKTDLSTVWNFARSVRSRYRSRAGLLETKIVLPNDFAIQYSSTVEKFKQV